MNRLVALGFFLLIFIAGLGFFIKLGLTEKTVAFVFFILFALVLSVIDFKYMCLPDGLTLGLLWMGLFFNLNESFVSIQDGVIGAMMGYGILWLTYYGFKLLTGKDGLGFGDFKFMAALGAWFGWRALPEILILSSLFGLIFWLIFKLIFKPIWKGVQVQCFATLEKAFPFGPAIALAGLVQLFLVF